MSGSISDPPRGLVVKEEWNGRPVLVAYEDQAARDRGKWIGFCPVQRLPASRAGGGEVSPDFAERMAQDRRTLILRLLEKCPGARAYPSALRDALARFGHVLDQVTPDLVWLRERGFLTMEVLGMEPHEARLTELGGDVARGRGAISVGEVRS